MSDIQQDLENALSRLLAGIPTNPELKRRLAEGSLRLSISTVAMEAGRSRTLIGYEHCAYPHIRHEILRAVEDGPRAARSRGLLKRAVTRIKELEERLAAISTINASLHVEIAKLRGEISAKRLRAVTPTHDQK